MLNNADIMTTFVKISMQFPKFDFVIIKFF